MIAFEHALSLVKRAVPVVMAICAVAFTKESQAEEISQSTSRAKLFVAKNGSDDNAGTSSETPLLTISAAIAKASGEGDGTVILVGPGTYTATNTAAAGTTVYALRLDKPNVAVVATEGPAVTTIDAGTDIARAEALISASGAFVSGFTFLNGCNRAKNTPSGVVMTDGVLSNCVIDVRGQRAYAGANLKMTGSTAKAYDIVIPPKKLDYTISGEGGALVYMEGAVSLDGLVITNYFYCKPGTGGYFVRINGSGKLRNALIADCTLGDVDSATLCPFIMMDSLKGTIADSTFARNHISANNGFVSGIIKATITNCIFWANTSRAETYHDFAKGENLNRVFSSCSAELTDGVNGNITSDPQFKNLNGGDYHLRSISPAREMGATWLRPQGEEKRECAADADRQESAAGESLQVTFTGSASGMSGEIAATWDFGDGTVSHDWPIAVHEFTTAGDYEVSLTVGDESGQNPVSFAFSKPFRVIPATCYVKGGGDGVYPYDTWAKATSNLVDAVAVGSRHIVVTNGTYGIPAPQLAINRALSIVSVEGPEKTVLVSLGGTTEDHRHFTFEGSDEILLAGFALEGGYAADYGWNAAVQMTAGTISNCVVRKTDRICRSAVCRFAGSAKAYDSIFDGLGLTVWNGSKAQVGILIEGDALMDRCVISGYRVDTSESAFIGSAPVSVRGNAILRNSLVHDCTNGVGQVAYRCGALTLLDSGRVENCTVVDNTVAGCGGGIYAEGGTVVNSIICRNQAGVDGNDFYAATETPIVTYSCSADLTAKDGNVPNTNGVFKAQSGKFKHVISVRSPTLNAGTLLDWMTDGAKDLLGNPRIINGKPDMGCLEKRILGLTLIVR